jgi:hypothetical protein
VCWETKCGIVETGSGDIVWCGLECCAVCCSEIEDRAERVCCSDEDIVWCGGEQNRVCEGIGEIEDMGNWGKTEDIVWCAG